MFAKISTVAFQGIEPIEVIVQVQNSSGLPNFQIVGLANKAVAESRERIRASLHNIGLALPAQRIIVNLAPADLEKDGSHYDLPIAIGILMVMGVLPVDELNEYIAVGELGLDGFLSKVPGILPAAIFANSQGKGIICPKKCGPEALWAGIKKILAPSGILQLINHFKGNAAIQPPLSLQENSFEGNNSIPKISIPNMADVQGQNFAKRAMEIAASGGHNLLMVGPPGSGKSMLAARMPSILPELSPQEALEVMTIHSIASLLPENCLIKSRPFRDPHHSASLPAIIGGGSKSTPGEISLAHNGILFLDELPEFSRQCLESLRQPLETGKVTIARVKNHITYPARSQLIAAMNPCRCGFYGDIKKQCNRVPKCKEEYQQKISGPLLDRFDIVVTVQALHPYELQKNTNNSENSQTIAGRVKNARSLQMLRYKGLPNNGSCHLNAHVNIKENAHHFAIDDNGQNIMEKAVKNLNLSARGYYKILRLSRTIADLKSSPMIGTDDLLEAIAYRKLL